MALSFIGKPISLISHSDVRYRGILAGIDTQASTIQLSNVYSMGTESRRPPAEFIPPVQDPYEYIIFRASEVKDLAVDDPTPRRSIHDDPAVLGASAQTPFNASAPQPVPSYAQQTRGNQQAPLPPTQQNPPVAAPPRHQNNGGRRNINPVQTAAASLETVERALGDLRVSNASANAGTGGANRHNNNRRPGPHKTTELKVPTTDFDFASSNAKFDKAAIAPKKKDSGDASEVDTNPSDGEGGKKDGKGKVKDSAYNPQKSFFDTLSPAPPAPTRGGAGGRGGHGGRNRREEEREKNVATFGEPGGVGLMGPGAYVGGWGGYGRRGGRPKRGTPAVNVGGR